MPAGSCCLLSSAGEGNETNANDSFQNPESNGAADLAATILKLNESVEILKISSAPADLCQDFGHGSSRNQAAIGIASGLGSVLSKKAAIASAGTL